MVQQVPRFNLSNLWAVTSLINSRTLGPINTGEATSEGYEVAASVDFTPYLELSANHTQTNSRRDRTGASLPGQASEETFARLRIGPENAWKLVGEVQRTGKILATEGGNRFLPTRTVWNTSAALNVAEIPRLGISNLASELWLFVRVNNVGDEAVRDALSFPQPGRHMSAGVDVVW